MNDQTYDTRGTEMLVTRQDLLHIREVMELLKDPAYAQTVEANHGEVTRQLNYLTMLNDQWVAEMTPR